MGVYCHFSEADSKRIYSKYILLETMLHDRHSTDRENLVLVVICNGTDYKQDRTPPSTKVSDTPVEKELLIDRSMSKYFLCSL